MQRIVPFWHCGRHNTEHDTTSKVSVRTHSTATAATGKPCLLTSMTHWRAATSRSLGSTFAVERVLKLPQTLVHCLSAACLPACGWRAGLG